MEAVKTDKKVEKQAKKTSKVAPQTEAQKLLAKLVKQGLSIMTIASKMDVNYFTAYRWSRGEHEPHMGTLKRLRDLVTAETK